MEKLTDTEARLAELIWEHEPVGSMRLVQLAEGEMNWKKSTTFTILRHLTEKGFFRNKNSEVSSLISRDEFRAAQSSIIVNNHFDGSLPCFVAAFTASNKLTAKDLEALREMIDSYQD